MEKFEKFVDNAMKEYYRINKTIESERHRMNFDRVRFMRTLEWLSELDFKHKSVLELGDYSLASYVIREFFNNNEYINTDFDLRQKFHFKENSFDFILNMEVMEHICDIEYTHGTRMTGIKQCLEECFFVLKPGGKMFLSTPNATSIWIIQRALLHQPPWLYPYHFRELLVDEIRDLVNNTGFKITKLATEKVWYFWDFAPIIEFMKKNNYSLENRGDDIFLIAEKPITISFKDGILKYREKDRNNPMYETWLNYSLTTNIRANEVVNLIKKFSDIAGKDYLDIGSGYGGCVIAFATQGAKKTIGIEMDDDLLWLSGLNLNEHSHLFKDKEVNIHKMNINEGDPKQYGKFDIITCDNVIEHILDPKGLIKKTSDALKPNGLCYFTVPNGFSIGQIRRDAHFGSFGITLLDRKDAEEYYRILMPEVYSRVGYRVGYFYPIGFYLENMRLYGLKFEIINEFRPDNNLIEKTKSELSGLKYEGEKFFNEKNIPSYIQSKVYSGIEKIVEMFNKEIDKYHRCSTEESRQKVLKDIYINYWDELWHITGRNNIGIIERLKKKLT